jgi:hypothetical protein
MARVATSNALSGGAGNTIFIVVVWKVVATLPRRGGEHRCDKHRQHTKASHGKFLSSTWRHHFIGQSW